MIIYNITVSIEPLIKEEWLTWIKMPIARMIGSGLFQEYRICHLLQDDEQEGITYTLQFTLLSLADYERYQKEYAPVIFEEFKSLYSGQYVCFRTIMEVL